MQLCLKYTEKWNLIKGLRSVADVRKIQYHVKIECSCCLILLCFRSLVFEKRIYKHNNKFRSSRFGSQVTLWKAAYRHIPPLKAGWTRR